MAQANQLAGQRNSTTHQQTCCLKTPLSHCHSRTRLCQPEGPEHGSQHQYAGTNPGTPRALQPETRELSSIHQWTSTSLTQQQTNTSPRTNTALEPVIPGANPPTSRLTPTPGDFGSLSQPPWNPDPPTNRPTPASGHPKPYSQPC